MKENLPDFSAFVVPIITKEVMNYKEQIKANELITKIRILRYVKKEHLPITEVAKSFSMHRNTIGNIIKAFERAITQANQCMLLSSGVQNSQEELITRYQNILNKKRIPRTH